jgi:hypothetical protein
LITKYSNLKLHIKVLVWIKILFYWDFSYFFQNDIDKYTILVIKKLINIIILITFFIDFHIQIIITFNKLILFLFLDKLMPRFFFELKIAPEISCIDNSHLILFTFFDWISIGLRLKRSKDRNYWGNSQKYIKKHEDIKPNLYSSCFITKFSTVLFIENFRIVILIKIRV